jgi:hypothetical protein
VVLPQPESQKRVELSLLDLKIDAAHRVHVALAALITDMQAANLDHLASWM